MAKIKISEYLVTQGYYPTRSQARNGLKASQVRVNGRIVTKDGYLVDENDQIEIRKPESQYVSRGGYKLEAALSKFKISLSDKTVLDIGASTGGFTDCCLQNGAKKVYSYDVGHDQLHDSLKDNPKIISKEGVNARYLTADDFQEEIDFICMDVSFISCIKMLPAISSILNENGEAVILFKPQFEVGKENLSDKGIVRNQLAVDENLQRCKAEADKLKLHCKGTIPSPIAGGDGNREYLLNFTKE